MLAGKRIVLGVTGGIAAYKSVEVCRRLVDAGAHVAPVMTAGAEHFLGVTTLSALASEPVRTRLWDDPETPIPHTKIGQGADLVLVAPATARLIGAYRSGLSTDLLTNVLLATRAPVVLAPAMHTEMWEHPAVVDNISTLRSWGVHIVEPESGRLLGAQAVGDGAVEKRIDVIAMALQKEGTVYDLEEAELCYAPQYGSAKDPVNVGGFVAGNALRGDVKVVHWDEWQARRDQGDSPFVDRKSVV